MAVIKLPGGIWGTIPDDAKGTDHVANVDKAKGATSGKPVQQTGDDKGLEQPNQDAAKSDAGPGNGTPVPARRGRPPRNRQTV